MSTGQTNIPNKLNTNSIDRAISRIVWIYFTFSFPRSRCDDNVTL